MLKTGTPIKEINNQESSDTHNQTAEHQRQNDSALKARISEIQLQNSHNINKHVRSTNDAGGRKHNPKPFFRDQDTMKYQTERAQLLEKLTEKGEQAPHLAKLSSWETSNSEQSPKKHKIIGLSNKTGASASTSSNLQLSSKGKTFQKKEHPSVTELKKALEQYELQSPIRKPKPTENSRVSPSQPNPQIQLVGTQQSPDNQSKHPHSFKVSLVQMQKIRSLTKKNDKNLMRRTRQPDTLVVLLDDNHKASSRAIQKIEEEKNRFRVGSDYITQKFSELRATREYEDALQMNIEFLNLIKNTDLQKAVTKRDYPKKQLKNVVSSETTRSDLLKPIQYTPQYNAKSSVDNSPFTPVKLRPLAQLQSKSLVKPQPFSIYNPTPKPQPFRLRLT